MDATEMEALLKATVMEALLRAEFLARILHVTIKAAKPGGTEDAEAASLVTALGETFNRLSNQTGNDWIISLVSSAGLEYRLDVAFRPPSLRSKTSDKALAWIKAQEDLCSLLFKTFKAIYAAAMQGIEAANYYNKQSLHLACAAFCRCLRSLEQYGK